MGFCRLLVVVLIFWPWHNSQGPFINYSNASSGENTRNAEDNRKKILGEMTFPFSLINLATRATQSLRRLLKMMRKWYTSHPSEVKLGKCFARYFNIKIPGLKRSLQYEDYDDLKNPAREMVKEYGTDPAKHVKETTGLTMKPLGKSYVFAIQPYLELISKNFLYYSDIFSKNELLVCTWNYFLKIFWNWIDSAPNE